MCVSRRRLLEVGTMSMVWAAMPLKGAVRKVTTSGVDVSGSDSNFLLTVSAANFQPLIGQLFQIYPEKGNPIRTTLASVKELTNQQTTGSEIVDGFVMQFSAPSAGKALPQNTYEFSNANLGTFPLFIVPSAPGGPRFYTAVINHSLA